MAHYAFLNSKNIVTEVIVGKDESDTTHDWEVFYGNIKNQTCKRTSYNTVGGVHINGGTPFRKNYAGVGYKYYISHDGFAPPKPYPSWTLNTTTLLWQPPTPYPTDGNDYEWNESNSQWVIDNNSPIN